MRSAECGMAADTGGYGTRESKGKERGARGENLRGIGGISRLRRLPLSPCGSPLDFAPLRPVKDFVEARIQHIKCHLNLSLFLLYLFVRLIIRLGAGARVRGGHPKRKRGSSASLQAPLPL